MIDSTYQSYLNNRKQPPLSGNHLNALKHDFSLVHRGGIMCIASLQSIAPIIGGAILITRTELAKEDNYPLKI